MTSGALRRARSAYAFAGAAYFFIALVGVRHVVTPPTVAAAGPPALVALDYAASLLRLGALVAMGLAWPARGLVSTGHSKLSSYGWYAISAGFTLSLVAGFALRSPSAEAPGLRAPILASLPVVVGTGAAFTLWTWHLLTPALRALPLAGLGLALVDLALSLVFVVSAASGTEAEATNAVRLVGTARTGTSALYAVAFLAAARRFAGSAPAPS